MMLNPSSDLVRWPQLPRYWERPKPLPASIIPAVKIILITWFIDTSKEIEIFKEGRTQIKVLRATLTKSLNPWLICPDQFSGEYVLTKVNSEVV